VEPDGVSQPELQRVVDVISHEIAHMWFGNLVTMRWWNGIWLNEAFATFMETSATDAFRPSWQRWVTFSLDRSSAFDVDALAATRPVEYEVVSPDDAEGMFDVLTYEKGGAVLRMLEQYLGPDRFREGVRRYLHTHQFDNTETTDLWDAIEAATGEPVRRLMDSWIFQGGFPVLHVEPTDGGVRLRQERFTYLPEARDDTRWVVPVLVRHGSDSAGVRTERVLLDGESAEVAVPEGSWVQVNAGASGFFRVQYAPELLEAVLVRTEHLDAAERYALVDDRWAAVLAGEVPAAEFVDFARRWSDEGDLAVWQRLLSGLAALDRLLEGEARDALAARVGELVSPARRRLADLDGDRGAGAVDDRTMQLRATLLENGAVLARDPAAVDEARAVWERYRAGHTTDDPASLAAAIDAVADQGGAGTFDEFWEHYRSAPSPQEELRFLGALADFPEADLFDRLLAATLTEEIRTQNAPYVLRRALTNRAHGGRAWAFVRDEWEAIERRFPSNSIARMLEGVRALSHPEQAEEVVAFFAAHDVPQGARIVAQHLERLRVNVALRTREGPRLAAALLAP
jgi:puromycin-sensitive aminopeptidase